MTAIQSADLSAGNSAAFAHPSQLAEELGIHPMTAAKYLRNSNLAPAGSFKFSKGEMRLYNRDDALAVLRKAVPKLNAKPKKARAVRTRAAAVDMSPVQKQLKGLDLSLSALHTDLEEWKLRSTAQKAVLLTQIEHLRASMAAINKALGIPEAV